MNISMSEIICPRTENLETPINPINLTIPRFFFSRDNLDSTSEIEHVPFPPQIVPLFLIILLPLICLKSPTFFTKFNSLGTANIFFLIGVVFYFATKWGINANFGDINADDYIPMFKAQNIHQDSKVEKILKGSLDSISSPSPSVKIQIMGGKVCLRGKAKHCWALSTSF